jgi:anti-sigma regulatory factor (Ser/Thr protein kinase)
MTGGTAVAIDVRYEARPQSVTAARHDFKDWLEGRVDPDQADGLLVVLSELAANSVRAESSWFRVKAALDGAEVVIEVADDGRGFDAVVPGPDDVPGYEAEDGRGLFLVRTLVDRCTIFTNGGGTIVRCRTKMRA